MANSFLYGLTVGLVFWSGFVYPFISQNPRTILCVSFSRNDSDFWIYHLFVWPKSNFLHNSEWITFPTQSYIVLNFFYNVINRFMSFSTQPTLAILMPINNFRFNIISLDGIVLLLLFLHWSFSHQRQLMVFHWSFSDSKSPQVCRTHLSILAVFNSAVWMVSTHPPTSNYSSLFSNPLVTVPKTPITIGTIVTCMFHRFFNSLARSWYLSFFSHSFSFILGSAETAKSTILQILSFFIIIRSGLLAEIRWSVCTSKSHRSLCVSFSRTGAKLCIIPFVGMVKFKFLVPFSVDHLANPIVSRLYYYYYYYYCCLQVFDTSVSWWSFTEVWIITSVFKSPGFFLVFWPISIILLFWWSPFVLRFPALQASSPSFVDRSECTNHYCHHHNLSIAL